MSAGGGQAGGDGQEFDLNLTPVLDCFTVLITYMLASASFISIDMLQVSVATSSPAPAASAEQPAEVPTSMSVELLADGALNLLVTGKEELKVAIPPSTAGGERDYPALLSRLQELRSKWPAVQEISVKGSEGVRYREIVRTIEALRTSFSKVYMSE